MPAPTEIATATPAFSNGDPAAEQTTGTPAHSNSNPGAALTPGGVPTLSNAGPEGDAVQGDAFSTDADSLGVYSDFTLIVQGGQSTVTFTAPFAGVLTALDTELDPSAVISGLGTVAWGNWPATVVPAGALVTVTFFDGGANEAQPVGDILRFVSRSFTNTPPSAISV